LLFLIYISILKKYQKNCIIYTDSSTS